MKVTVKYGVDSINRTVASGSTVGSIKSNSAIKSALGFGDNTRALINGVEVDNDAELSDGMEIRLETAANSKAAPGTITVHYGVDSMARTYDHAVTVAELKRDARLKAGLGFGDNVRVLINGVEQPDDVVIPEAEVRIETASNSKAVTA